MPSVTFARGILFTELSDAELSAIRGMYVSRSKIQYFGLSMATQWGTPDRTTHNVGMSIAMRVDGNTPNVQITRSGNIGSEVDASSVTRAEVNPALEQIGGVVQSIQVAGVDNAVHNKLALNIIEYEAVEVPDQQLDLPNGRQAYQANNGVSTDFSISDQKLGYNIATEQGVVTQALAYNALTNTNQLLQSVNIFGNGQRVVNSIRLDVAFENTRQLRTSNTHFGIRGLLGR